MKKVLIFAVLISFIFVMLFPQDTKSFYYSPEEANMLMIRVNVWGQVNHGSSILVPDGTDLITAVSYAGGPTVNAEISNVTVIRADGSRLKCNIGQFKSENDRKNNPILKPGDTIIIKSSPLYTFSRALQFIYQVAVIVTSVVTVWNLWDTISTP